jgi:hypothetical protein
MKKFHVFFLKIATYQSTPKNLYMYKGTKERTKTYPNPPPLLILTNIFFIKIDPYGIEFAIIIPRPCGFGNIVAWGHKLRLPLQSQNWEFGASSSKNCLAANKNHLQR